MSLADAVLEIAADMDKHAVSDELRSYSAQLRIAVKAAGNELGVQKDSSPGGYNYPTQQELHKQDMVRQEAEMLRVQRRRTEAEEGLGQRMLEVKGGPADNTFVPSPEQGLQEGVKTLIAGVVYVYQGGCWNFSKEDTEKRKVQMEEKSKIIAG